MATEDIKIKASVEVNTGNSVQNINAETAALKANSAELEKNQTLRKNMTKVQRNSADIASSGRLTAAGFGSESADARSLSNALFAEAGNTELAKSMQASYRRQARALAAIAQAMEDRANAERDAADKARRATEPMAAKARIAAAANSGISQGAPRSAQHHAALMAEANNEYLDTKERERYRLSANRLLSTNSGAAASVNDAEVRRDAAARETARKRDQEKTEADERREEVERVRAARDRRKTTMDNLGHTIRNGSVNESEAARVHLTHMLRNIEVQGRSGTNANMGERDSEDAARRLGRLGISSTGDMMRERDRITRRYSRVLDGKDIDMATIGNTPDGQRKSLRKLEELFKVQEEWAKNEEKIESVQSRLTRARSDRLRYLGQGMQGVGMVMTAAAGVGIATGGFAVKSYADEQEAFVRLLRFGTNPDERKYIKGPLRQDLRKMVTEGGLALPIEKAYSIAEEGYLQGVSGKAISPYVNTVGKFSAITGMSSDAAATDMARVIAMTSNENRKAVPGESSADKVSNDIKSYAAGLLGADQVVKGHASDILSLSKNLTAYTGVLKMSQQEITILAATLVDGSIKAEKGATQVGKTLTDFIKIVVNSEKGDPKRNNLLNIMGLGNTDEDLAKLKKALGEDALGVFEHFLQRLKGYKDINANSNIMELLHAVGIDNQREIQVISSSFSNQNRGKITEAVRANSKKPDVIDSQYDDVSSDPHHQFQILKNQIKDVAIDLGEGLIPILKDVVTAGKPLLQFISDMVHKFGGADSILNKIIFTLTALMAILGPVAIGIGRMMFAVSSFGEMRAAGQAAQALTAALKAEQSAATILAGSLDAAGVASSGLAGTASAANSAVIAGGEAALKSSASFLTLYRTLGLAAAALLAVAWAYTSISDAIADNEEWDRKLAASQAYQTKVAMTGGDAAKELNDTKKDLKQFQADSVSLIKMGNKPTDSALQKVVLTATKYVPMEELEDVIRKKDNKGLVSATLRRMTARILEQAKKYESDANTRLEKSPGSDAYPSLYPPIDIFSGWNKPIHEPFDNKVKAGLAKKLAADEYREAMARYGSLAEQDEKSIGREHSASIREKRPVNDSLIKKLADRMFGYIKARDDAKFGLAGVEGMYDGVQVNTKQLATMKSNQERDRKSDRAELNDKNEKASQNAANEIARVRIEQLAIERKALEASKSDLSSRLSMADSLQEQHSLRVQSLGVERKIAFNAFLAERAKVLAIRDKPTRQKEWDALGKQFGDPSEILGPNDIGGSVGRSINSGEREVNRDSILQKMDARRKASDSKRWKAMTPEFGLEEDYQNASHVLDVDDLTRLLGGDGSIRLGDIFIDEQGNTRLGISADMFSRLQGFYKAGDIVSMVELLKNELSADSPIMPVIQAIMTSGTGEGRGRIESGLALMPKHTLSQEQRGLAGQKINESRYRRAMYPLDAAIEDRNIDADFALDPVSALSAADASFDAKIQAANIDPATRQPLVDSSGKPIDSRQGSILRRQKEASLRTMRIKASMYSSSLEMDKAAFGDQSAIAGARGGFNDALNSAVDKDGNPVASERRDIYGGHLSSIFDSMRARNTMSGGINRESTQGLFSEAGVALYGAEASGDSGLYMSVSKQIADGVKSMFDERMGQIGSMPLGQQSGRITELIQFTESIGEWKSLPAGFREVIEEMLKGAKQQAKMLDPFLGVVTKNWESFRDSSNSSAKGFLSSSLGGAIRFGRGRTAKDRAGRRDASKDAAKQFWDSLLTEGSNSLVNTVWDGILEKRISRMFKSLQNGLWSVWKDGEGSWSKMIAASMNVLFLSGKAGKKAQKGSMWGTLIGAAIGSVIPGVGTMMGASIGGAIGGGSASGGAAGGLAAGAGAYLAFKPGAVGGAGKDKLPDGAVNKSVKVTNNNTFHVSDMAVADYAASRTSTRTERAIHSGK